MARLIPAPHIRLAHEGDAEGIAAIYRPIVESTAISFETVAPDAAEVGRRIEETLRGYPWLVCEIDGGVAGYAYATKHRVRAAYQWSVDTSVYVEAGYRRRGIGRGLYRSLFAILSAQGYFNAFAGIALPNAESVSVHEAVGFEPVGVYRRVGFKFGQWRDVGWWQLTVRAHEGSPEPPLVLPALRQRADWAGLPAAGESLIRARAA